MRGPERLDGVAFVNHAVLELKLEIQILVSLLIGLVDRLNKDFLKQLARFAMQLLKSNKN